MRFGRSPRSPKPGRSTRILAGALAAGLLGAGEAAAEPVGEPPTAASSEERIQALEAKVQALAEELRAERIQALEAKVQALAEELSAERIAVAVPVDSEFDPVWGVGPSASKVYGGDSGLSIGGYGEVRFRHDNTDDDVFDALRAVLYLGYKFSDSWVLNSEIEFEHGGGSDVFVEFLNLDYLHSDALNFRVGLILIPMGFVNQLHEPTFYYGASRPEVENTIENPARNRKGLWI